MKWIKDMVLREVRKELSSMGLKERKFEFDRTHECGYFRHAFQGPEGTHCKVCCNLRVGRVPPFDCKFEAKPLQDPERFYNKKECE